MNANFYGLVQGALSDAPDATALETDDGRIFRRADIARESARIANLLLALGARRGDRIVVQVEKSPPALFLYLACLRAGLVFVPLNTAYRRGELSHFIADAEPSMIVCGPQAVEIMGELSAGRARVLSLDEAGEGSLARGAATQPGECEIA